MTYPHLSKMGMTCPPFGKGGEGGFIIKNEELSIVSQISPNPYFLKRGEKHYFHGLFPKEVIKNFMIHKLSYSQIVGM